MMPRVETINAIQLTPQSGTFIHLYLIHLYSIISLGNNTVFTLTAQWLCTNTLAWTATRGVADYNIAETDTTVCRSIRKWASV